MSTAKFFDLLDRTRKLRRQIELERRSPTAHELRILRLQAHYLVLQQRLASLLASMTPQVRLEPVPVRAATPARRNG